MLEGVAGGPRAEPAGEEPRYRQEAGRGEEREHLLFLRHQQGDRAAREQLVERYLPLARALARRYRAPDDGVEDLFQVASLALVKAIDRFDPGRHAGFSSYAVPTILGEIKRHFRDRAWAVRVPRDLQELALKVMNTEQIVSRWLGRPPTVAELAAELGLPVEQVVEAQEAATAYRAVPLEPVGSDDDRPGFAAVGREDPGFGRAEQRALIGSLMADVPPREREILRLRFEEDLTQSEIAARIGLSQMQVSRLIRQAISRMQDAAGR